MVALNVQCSMFNGESLLQLPRRVVVAAAIRAATLVLASLRWQASPYRDAERSPS